MRFRLAPATPLAELEPIHMQASYFHQYLQHNLVIEEASGLET